MIGNRDVPALITDQWGRFRSVCLRSPTAPSVGPGDDGFLWLDIGVDGTPETPVWKVWDEPQGVWRIIAGGAGHDPVTLSAEADAILSLNNQELGLDVQSAHTVLAGPTSGSATPTFRALEAGDLGGIIDTDVTLSSNSDSKVPSQKATKTYVDNAIATRAPSEHKHYSLAASDGSPDPALSVDADGNVSVVGNIAIPGTLTVGTDVHIFRGAANRLDLASGDSLNIVSGALQIAGTTAIDSGRDGSLTGLTVSGGINVGSATGAGTGHVRASGDVYARNDNRGLAARVYEPYGTSTDHFRSGSIPSGFYWIGTTPTSIDYSYLGDYLRVRPADNSECALVKFLSGTSVIGKRIRARVIPTYHAYGGLIIYYVIGSMFYYVKYYLARNSYTQVDRVVSYYLPGGSGTVTQAVGRGDQAYVMELYHDSTSNQTFFYLKDEVGDGFSPQSTGVAISSFDSARIGLYFRDPEPGGYGMINIDWFWTDA